jgi:hypothetical protein
MKAIAILFLILMLGSCASFPRNTQEPPRFTVTLDSHQVPLGTINMQRERNFPRTGLIRFNAEVIYFPDEDLVCLRYRTDFFTYHLFWDMEARDAFRTALETYTEDFANRNLDRNSRDSSSKYGTVESYLIWQEMRFTLRYRGNTTIDMGYEFKNRMPYFSITQNMTFFADPAEKRSTTSQEVSMYFTREQARELEALFDEDLLQIHARPRIERRNIGDDFGDDYYDEYIEDDGSRQQQRLFPRLFDNLFP